MDRPAPLRRSRRIGLTPERQRRALDALDRLEHAALGTERWAAVVRLVARARFCAERGFVLASDVRPLAEAFREHGVTGTHSRSTRRAA